MLKKTAAPTPTIEDEVEDPDKVDFDDEMEDAKALWGGEQWEPPTVVFGGTPGRDGVPNYDDDLDRDPHAAPRTYPDWTSENSFVVSGGPEHAKESLRMNRAQALKWAKEKYGMVYERYQLPEGRWAFRVPKPAPKGEP